MNAYMWMRQLNAEAARSTFRFKHGGPTRDSVESLPLTSVLTCLTCHQACWIYSFLCTLASRYSPWRSSASGDLRYVALQSLCLIVLQQQMCQPYWLKPYWLIATVLVLLPSHGAASRQALMKVFM